MKQKTKRIFLNQKKKKKKKKTEKNFIESEESLFKLNNIMIMMILNTKE